MFRRVKIRELERAVAWRGGRSVRWLRPGTHWLLGFGWNVHVLPTGERAHPLDVKLPIERLSHVPEARSDVTFVRLATHERALVWVDGRLEHVLDRALTAILTLRHKVRVEIHDARSLVLDPGVPVETALALDRQRRVLGELVVPAGSTGFLYLDGRFVAELEPGRYAAWRGVGQVRLERVPRGPASLVHLVREVWTRDLTTLEIELVATYRVDDARAWADSQGKALASVRFVAEAALRRVVGASACARALGDSSVLELELERAIAGLVPERVVSILGARLRRRRLVRRLPRPRFRGFGDRGREVALAVRDFATRPRLSVSASGRRH